MKMSHDGNVSTEIRRNLITSRILAVTKTMGLTGQPEGCLLKKDKSLSNLPTFPEIPEISSSKRHASTAPTKSTSHGMFWLLLMGIEWPYNDG
ncbi:hypothetical protein ACE6H2_013618 [Prunus campanulata]